MNKIRIAVVGTGRMGAAIAGCIAGFPNITIGGKINRSTSQSDRVEIIKSCDVVVDFSSADATIPIAQICVDYEKPLIIGTTGHTEAQLSLINDHYASKIAIIRSSNFSMGVNLLFVLTYLAAEALPGSDIEILEIHHRLKKDSPSGTAKTLAEIAARARGHASLDVMTHGRSGMLGARPSTEIGMHAIRGGDVVGEHTVMCLGNGERVELTHKASTRDTFAQGALSATNWIFGRSPGMYSMNEVLGLDRFFKRD